MNLNNLLGKANIKLYFRAESITDLNTASGFMSVLGIQRKRAVIGCSSKAIRTIAKFVLKGCAFTRGQTLCPNWFPVRFDNEGGVRFAERGIIINYVPYKYCLKVHVDSKERACIRSVMKINKDRRVIVASCSTRDEAEALLKAYDGLCLSQKPLLILGMIKPNSAVENFLARHSFRAHIHRSYKQNLFHIGKSDVAVLNTMGELFNFFKVADLAIIGHDRNIFEPALLGVPILYFQSPLNMDKKERELAKLFDLVWRKNRMAKKLLDKFGGAAQIRRDDFCQQMDRILLNPKLMIRGTRKATREFHQMVIPVNRSQAALVLSNAINYTAL